MVRIKKIYVADFETSTSKTEYFKKHNDSIVYLGYMMNLRDTNEIYKFTTIDTFYQTIRKMTESTLIYFHNLAFDGYFIYKYLIKQGIKWYNDIPPKKTGFSVFRNGTKIYQIDFKFYNLKKYVTINFKCSLRILSASIESLGQVFGIQKYEDGDDDSFYHNEPLKKWDEYPKRFIEYTINDVEVMRRSLLAFEESISKINLKTMEQNRKIDWVNCMTIGGLAMKLQRNYIRTFSYRKYGNNSIFNGLKINDESYKLAQKFFYGGWSQFNPQIHNQTLRVDGFSIDINSAHPYSMSQLLPYGDVYDASVIPYPTDSKYLVYYEIRVKKAIQIYPQVVNLLNWNKRWNENKDDFEYTNRYCKIQSNFTCYYLKDEWELLQKFYKFTGVKILKTYWIKADYFLTDFVNDVYSLRYEYKERKEIAMSNCFKILLNSAYGKWGSRQVYREEFITDHPTADYMIGLGNCRVRVKDKAKRYNIIGKSQMFSTPDYAVVIMEEDSIKNKNFNKWIAGTITAYTRINLWKTLLTVGVENFLYADTDSLYLKKCDISKLDIDKVRLGAWDVEVPHFAYFRVNGSKVYALLDENKKVMTDKAKYSGISQRWLKKNVSLELYDTQESTFKNANTRPMYLESGIAIVEKDYTAGKRGL